MVGRDTARRLIEQIRLGEDSELELKAVHVSGDKITGPRREKLAEEIVAFANSNGGTILLGVEDSTRAVVGIPAQSLDAVERLVQEASSDLCKPPVHFDLHRLLIPDDAGIDRPVIRVRVPKSLFVHSSSGRYLRRQGSAVREIPPEALARLFQQRSQARLIRFDEQAVPDTSIDTLDPQLWRRFVTARLGADEVALRKLKLLVEDQDGELRASVAGVLMCSRKPTEWLPNAMITCVHYRGTRPDANNQITAKNFTYHLDRQIEEAFDFVRDKMWVAAKKIPGRVDFPEFSLHAVYEAIVNAVGHRDYSIYGSKIRLFMFDDRLELYSPGALPNSLTIDSMEARQSTRNELLTTLLSRCEVPDSQIDDVGRAHLMEKRGEGVPIIFAETKRVSGKLASYRLIDDAELLLTMPAAKNPNVD